MRIRKALIRAVARLVDEGELEEARILTGYINLTRAIFAPGAERVPFFEGDKVEYYRALRKLAK